MNSLFELDYKSSKNFGVDLNGLLTCNERDYNLQKNPYVGVTVVDGKITARCCITNEILRDLEEKEWYIEALNKGIFSAKMMRSSQSAIVNFGVFKDDEVLLAAWVAQVTRFSEDAYDRISDLLQGKIDGTFTEKVEALKKECPAFTHEALKAYDKESFIRMAKIQEEKRKPYIEALKRIARGNGFSMNDDFKILNKVAYISSEYIEKLQGQFRRTSKNLNEFFNTKYEQMLKEYGR